MSKPTDQPVMDFPCDFPIKAMGNATPEFESEVAEIVRRHAPEIGDDDIRTRPSSNGKYLSITVMVRAESRAQLDAIYMDLTACQHVLMAL